jgi:hypothetical protein
MVDTKARKKHIKEIIIPATPKLNPSLALKYNFFSKGSATFFCCFFNFLPKIIAIIASIIEMKEIIIPQTGYQKNQQKQSDAVPVITEITPVFFTFKILSVT